jgi:hypothetical protein
MLLVTFWLVLWINYWEPIFQGLLSNINLCELLYLEVVEAISVLEPIDQLTLNPQCDELKEEYVKCLMVLIWIDIQTTKEKPE